MAMELTCRTKADKIRMRKLKNNRIRLHFDGDSFVFDMDKKQAKKIGQLLSAVT